MKTIAEIEGELSHENGSFWRPSPIESVAQFFARHSCSFSPLGYAKRLSAHRQKPVVPFISRLFFGCRPSAIRRFIIAISVNAVNRVSLGTLAHVSKKIVERCSPFWTEFDAATAVNAPAFVVRIFASRNHRHVNSVRATSRLPMLGGTADCFFNLEAAAAFSFAAHQLTGGNSCVRSTLTLTKPLNFRASFWGFFQDSQIVECLASQIVKSSAVLSHCVKRTLTFAI